MKNPDLFLDKFLQDLSILLKLEIDFNRKLVWLKICLWNHSFIITFQTLITVKDVKLKRDSELVYDGRHATRIYFFTSYGKNTLFRNFTPVIEGVYYQKTVKRENEEKIFRIFHWSVLIEWGIDTFSIMSRDFW